MALAGSALLGVITGLVCLAVARHGHLVGAADVRTHGPLAAARSSRSPGCSEPPQRPAAPPSADDPARHAPRPAPDPGGDGPRPRRRVHGAGRARLPPGPQRGPPAPGGPVQQRQLPPGVTIAVPGDPRTSHAQPVDVSGAGPTGRLRPGHRPLATPRSGSPWPTWPPRSRSSSGSTISSPSRGTAGRSRGLPIGGRTRGRRHVRDRRRRVERPAGVPRCLAEPPSPDAGGRELPERDPRLVPRGNRLGARDDRNGRVPQDPWDHRAQPPRRTEGLRKAYGELGAREPGRHPHPDPRGPVERRDRQPGLDRRARVPGLAPRDDRLRRAVATGRPAAGGRVLGRRSRPTGLAEPERRALPDAGGGAPARRVRHLSRRVRPEPGSQQRIRSREAEEHALLQHARDPLPGRPRRGDARERAGRIAGRDRPPVRELQGPRLHGSRLRDVRPDDG